MTRRGNLVLGLVLMALVALGIGSITCQCFPPGVWPPTPTPAPTVPPTATPAPVTQLYVYGGYRYFGDKEIMAILHEQYHIDVKGEFRKGTFAMCDDYDPAKQPVDCIFPGSKIGIDYCKEKRPGLIGNSTVVAQDRIILYTWKELLPALQEAGLVYGKDNSWYIRMKPLVDAMMAEKQWHDLGADIPGYVRVEHTDPLKSSTGLQWLAFVGTYLVPGNEAGGKILTVDDLQANPIILEQLRTYWEQQGAQVDTTAKLFGKFVSSGAGMPMITAYESSFTDWYHPLPADQKALAAGIVGIYPEYTINVEHTLASLTPACAPLLEAINNPQIQPLAWANHGLYPQGYVPEGCPPGASWCAVTVSLIPEPKKDVTDAISKVLQ